MEEGKEKEEEGGKEVVVLILLYSSSSYSQRYEFFLAAMPPVSTLTFYDIEDDESLRDIAASIEDRFWEIVRLNPWLSGNLRVSTNGLPLLVYDEKNYKCEGMFQLFAPGEVDLSRNTSYKHYNACLKNAKAEVSTNTVHCE